MTTIRVNPQGEKSLKRCHPWLFSGAIIPPKNTPAYGETVAVYSRQGRWLAWGAYSPKSQIRIRVWSFDEAQEITPLFFQNAIETAVARRCWLPGFHQSTARRWINAESDGLPGLIVDQYGDFLVCQFLTAGTEYWKAVITDQLHKLIPSRGIYERSDVDVRLKEGLTPHCGVLMGDPPPPVVQVQLCGMMMAVDLIQGHKTGLYLDQIHNQAMVRPYAQGAEVLNCFSYTGGFGLQALKGGATHVTQIDASQPALELSRQNLMLNALDPQQATHVNGNVFEQLRQYRDVRRQFDLIILDPPKFVASKSQLNKGTRGYKDINLLAFKLLRPGGLLVTFSCSGLVTPMLFQKIVADAALDAGRRACILRQLNQGVDHPVALNFPEGHYLKGLICQVH